MSDITYRLMVKKHNVTGLRYLCISCKEDFDAYTGSGTRWKQHLRVHGADITTSVLFETEDRDSLSAAGEFFSSYFAVVESRDWANIIPEWGYHCFKSIDAKITFGERVSAARLAMTDERKAARKARILAGRSAREGEYKAIFDQMSIDRHVDGIKFETVRKVHEEFGLSLYLLYKYFQNNPKEQYSFDEIQHLKPVPRVKNRKK